MIGVAILGATGSIGASTLSVLDANQDRFRVVALSANRDVAELLRLCQRYAPDYAVMADESAARQLEIELRGCNSCVRVLAGSDGFETIAALDSVDYVVAAIVGAAGLLPTLAAARAGKRILLANKEALVMSGELFMREVRDHGARLLPVDSEHNAVFQCLPDDYGGSLADAGVRHIWLTASGGPIRTLSLDRLDSVTPEQACKHPNWVMGRKISVDSATMMNKGLEVIEACWLFNAHLDQVKVVIHPQSVVHSLVEYEDGSFLCQLGSPDMRTPIAHALAWPRRIRSGVQALNLFEAGHLQFESPDEQRFPCLTLARDAIRAGGTASTILNASNEEAVTAFLDKRVRFTDIAEIVSETMQQLDVRAANSLECILDDDQRARQVACDIISRKARER